MAKPGPVVERFSAMVNKTVGCWLWLGSRNAKGYGRFNSDGKTIVLAHRFAWEMVNGNVPDDLCVLHRCDVPECVRPDHLFLGTRIDNNADMVAKGRQAKGEAVYTGGCRAHPERRPRGEGHVLSKVTVETVLRIRKAIANGETKTAVSRWAGISRVQVRRIAVRQSWAHVTEAQ